MSDCDLLNAATWSWIAFTSPGWPCIAQTLIVPVASPRSAEADAELPVSDPPQPARPATSRPVATVAVTSRTLLLLLT